MLLSMPFAALRLATVLDVPVILEFIRLLAAYERLLPNVVASEDGLREHLFGAHPFAEDVLAEHDGRAVGFALFFPTFSTFVGRPGIYLEDLYVREEVRGKGVGRQLLSHVARLTIERGWSRLDWAVLDWNAPAIGFYNKLGAQMLIDWRICRLAGPSLDALAASSGEPPSGRT
jgi:GNAT superfamily N-acetyltransferase